MNSRGESYLLVALTIGCGLMAINSLIDRQFSVPRRRLSEDWNFTPAQAEASGWVFVVATVVLAVATIVSFHRGKH